MRQRVHLITLGVDDLERSAGFYEALGWSRADGPPGIVAFDLYGATLGLYPREDLARDMGVDTLPRGSGAVTLACNTREKSEVAEVLATAEAAGAKILKPAHDVFWGGHVGYFSDLDGNTWEVAWNPHSPLGPNDEFQWSGA